MSIEKSKLISFIYKERKKHETKNSNSIISSSGISDKKIPWYKRVLNKDEFICKLAKNGRWYARHNEWSKRIWIGPYKEKSDCESTIDSYIKVSQQNSILDKVISSTSNVHSLVIENPNEFF